MEESVKIKIQEEARTIVRLTGEEGIDLMKFWNSVASFVMAGEITLAEAEQFYIDELGLSPEEAHKFMSVMGAAIKMETEFYQDEIDAEKAGEDE